MSKTQIFLNSFGSIVMLMAMVYSINWLTLALQPLGEMIFTQSYIKDPEQDKEVISFHGLMLVQKAFVWLVVAAVMYVWPMVGKLSTTNKETISKSEQAQTDQLATQATTPYTTPLKYQHPAGIAIALFSTTSLLLFAHAQQTLYIDCLSQIRHAGCFVSFIIIHFWFLTENKLMKINLNNFLTQVLYLAFKAYQFYYLLLSVHFIISRSVPYDHYFGLWYEQFNTGEFRDVSFSSKPGLWAAAALEGAMYFTIFLFKSYHTNTLSTLRMLLIMVKYSTMALLLYTIYYGDLLQTLHFVFAFTQGYSTIIQYCMVNFVIYLIYAHCIASYPPTVFIVVLLTRRLFEKYQQHAKDDAYIPHYQVVFIVLGVLALQMIKYAWFDETDKLKAYNKINRKPNQEMTEINMAVESGEIVTEMTTANGEDGFGGEDSSSERRR